MYVECFVLTLFTHAFSSAIKGGMPQKAGPEREHFGGLNGLFSETNNGKTRYYWKCIHCDWQMGGKTFANEKARIHLSGDPMLRNGMISNVCKRAPAGVKSRFAALVRSKREERCIKVEKRKRAQTLLQSVMVQNSPATKQSKLAMSKTRLSDERVDDAWGEAFFGLDIPPNKIDHPLFREAIAATKLSKFK